MVFVDLLRRVLGELLPKKTQGGDDQLYNQITQL